MADLQTGTGKTGMPWWAYAVVLSCALGVLNGAFESATKPAKSGTLVEPHVGNPAASGGVPTVREPYYEEDDDPDTTNDESNDQPRGHFGTVTLSVCSVESGNCYSLDGDVSGTTLDRVYFPKGGWVDFLSCELDDDLTGDCDDEEGRQWTVEGES